EVAEVALGHVAAGQPAQRLVREGLLLGGEVLHRGAQLGEGLGDRLLRVALLLRLLQRLLHEAGGGLAGALEGAPRDRAERVDLRGELLGVRVLLGDLLDPVVGPLLELLLLIGGELGEHRGGVVLRDLLDRLGGGDLLGGCGWLELVHQGLLAALGGSRWWIGGGGPTSMVGFTCRSAKRVRRNSECTSRERETPPTTSLSICSTPSPSTPSWRWTLSRFVSASWRAVPAKVCRNPMVSLAASTSSGTYRAAIPSSIVTSGADGRRVCTCSAATSASIRVSSDSTSSSTRAADGVLRAPGRSRATRSRVVASASRIRSSTARVPSGTEASSTGRSPGPRRGALTAMPTPPRVTAPRPAAAARASSGPPSPVPSTTIAAASAARPPSTTGAPKRTSGGRRGRPTAREAGERTVPSSGSWTGPHRSRRSAVAFQGRS